MHKTITILATLFLSVQLSAADRSIMSQADASLLGLEQAWGRTLMAGSGDGLVDVRLHVDETREVKYIDIFDGEQLVWRTAVGSLDPRFGLPRSEAMVRKEAERELLFMKARGKTGTIKEKTVPRIWLFALGRDGTVQAIDAETGETQWLERVGNPLDPKYDLAVNDNYVVFVSGASMVQLKADTGEIVSVERTETIPIGAPTLVGDYVILTTTAGGIEGHWADDITMAPTITKTSGQAAAKPARFPKSSKFVWPTDRGYVYCMEAHGAMSELFRLDTEGRVSGRVETVGRDKLYCCTQGGYVYGFTASRLGQLLWQVSTGEPMYGDTIAIDENIYCTAGSARLYAFKAENGSQPWASPLSGVSRVLGSIGDAVFVRDTRSSLSVVSAVTGHRAATTQNLRMHRAVVNRGTDRLYLVSEHGFIQCLRAQGRELPEIKIAIEPKPKNVGPSATKPAAQQQPKADPFGAGATDPFGAGNPFDAGGADAGAGAGAGADPFGAAAGGGGADPFGGGGGADPFGAGNDPF